MFTSLPMRERELKLGLGLRALPVLASLPMRERELKPRAPERGPHGESRSPCGSVN